MPKRNLRITIDIPFSCDYEHTQLEYDNFALRMEQDPFQIIVAMIGSKTPPTVSAKETPPIEPKKEKV